MEAFKRALDIAERYKACVREYEGFLAGLDGEYIEPGPAGSLTRG